MNHERPRSGAADVVRWRHCPGSARFARAAFPSIGGVAPDSVPFRYPHYHQITDTPDKVDMESLARVIKGMERVIRDAVR